MADDEKDGPFKAAPKHVVEQLLETPWGELEVLEHVGYLLFPDSIYKRKRNGEFEEVKVALRVPRQHELRKARVQAREIALRDGLNPELDRDMIGDIETVCILSMSIRNRTEPHEPMVPDPLELEKTYDRACLMQMWAKLDAVHRLVDPAPETMSEEEMFALIAAIAKERNIAPLAVYGAALQPSFVIFMACMLAPLLEAMKSPESKSSSEPSGSSTPE